MYSWGYNQCDPALKIQGWMDCNQMQTMNALSILIAIPIIDFAVYPILTKMNIKLTHVHKIGAKSTQNEAKSGPGAVPETLPKKSSKKLPKVNQKAPKVDQKAPQNDPENVFKIKKNGLGAFVSTSNKR